VPSLKLGLWKCAKCDAWALRNMPSLKLGLWKCAKCDAWALGKCAKFKAWALSRSYMQKIEILGIGVISEFREV